MERAEHVVREGLKRLEWSEKDLERRAKEDADKVKLAMELRSKTTASVTWIAERLKMGTSTYLNHLLYGSDVKGDEYYNTRNRTLFG